MYRQFKCTPWDPHSLMWLYHTIRTGLSNWLNSRLQDNHVVKVTNNHQIIQDVQSRTHLTVSLSLMPVWYPSSAAIVTVRDRLACNGTFLFVSSQGRSFGYANILQGDKVGLTLQGPACNFTSFRLLGKCPARRWQFQGDFVSVPQRYEGRNTSRDSVVPLFTLSFRNLLSVWECVACVLLIAMLLFTFCSLYFRICMCAKFWMFPQLWGVHLFVAVPFVHL